MSDPTPRPATDTLVESLKKAALDYESSPGKTPLDNLVWGMAALIARIDQEREMRRELQRVLEKTTNELQAVRMSGDGRALAVIQTANLALGRAAKMEEDNG